jgi:hypothetical protein
MSNNLLDWLLLSCQWAPGPGLKPMVLQAASNICHWRLLHLLSHFLDSASNPDVIISMSHQDNYGQILFINMSVICWMGTEAPIPSFLQPRLTRPVLECGMSTSSLLRPLSVCNYQAVSEVLGESDFIWKHLNFARYFLKGKYYFCESHSTSVLQ